MLQGVFSRPQRGLFPTSSVPIRVRKERDVWGKGTGTFCRNGPAGASHKRRPSPLSRLATSVNIRDRPPGCQVAARFSLPFKSGGLSRWLNAAMMAALESIGGHRDTPFGLQPAFSPTQATRREPWISSSAKTTRCCSRWCAILSKRDQPIAAKIDEEHAIPDALLKKMGAMGFMGSYFPEPYGGAGLDMLSYVIVVEEISKASGSVGVLISAHRGRHRTRFTPLAPKRRSSDGCRR